jgi:hypothetical protein
MTTLELDVEQHLGGKSASCATDTARATPRLSGRSSSAARTVPDRAGTPAAMIQPALSRLEAGGVIPTIPLLERITTALDADLIIEIAPHAA